MYGLIKYKGTIVHVSNRLLGLNETCNFPGRAVLGIARRQKAMKLDVAVVVPQFKDIKKSLKYETVNPACIKYEIRGIPVYVLTGPSYKGKITSWKQGYEHFPAAFWRLMEEKKLFPKIALVQGHGQTMASIFADVPESLSNIKTIFTPYVIKKVTRDMKIGMVFADTTTIWTRGDWSKLLKSYYGNFFENAFERKNVFILSASKSLFNEISFTKQIIKEIMNNLYETYLKTIYSSGYDLSMNILKNKYVPSNVLINVTERMQEKTESKGEIISKGLNASLRCGNIMHVSRGPAIGVTGYRGNFGGIIQMFSKIASLKSNGNDSLFAVLDGGGASRLSVVGLASCGKGEVRLIDKTLNEITIKQASILAQQLPDYGKGWTLLSSNDNIMIPYGPIMNGRDFLHNAKQKILIFAKKIKVRGVHRSDVNYLKNLVTILADSKSGSLSELYVHKKDPVDGEYDLDFILSRLNDLGGDEIYKGTYYFAMTNDIVKMMAEAYSVPSKKDGKPMHETYELDFEMDFIGALAQSREEWMKKYSLTNIERGVPIAQIYNVDDWEYLWETANKIKQAAGGVGIASLNEESIWADLGTLKELVRVSLETVRGRMDSAPLRKLLDMGEKSSVENSYINDVSLPPSEETAQGILHPFFIKHSVFRKGGKVGKNCVIVDSVFEEYAEIPDNTIIIGSHIYKASTPESSDRQDGLIYMYRPRPDIVTNFKGGLAQSTVYTMNGVAFNGSIPIRLDLDVPKLAGKDFSKDPILKHYVLNGNIAEQEIYGIGVSFKILKNGASLKYANRAYSRNMNYIDRLLKELR